MNEVDDGALVRRERDLYRRLLDLGQGDDPEAFLQEALDVAVQATGAARGYLAIFDADPVPGRAPRSRMLWGFDDVAADEVERMISTTILREALVTGEVLHVSNAALSAFAGANSVVFNRIEAVLCAPIGDARRGVIYLQGATEGTGSPNTRRFTEEHVGLLGMYARHLVPIVDRMLLRARLDRADPTARFREGGRFESIVGRSAALAQVLERATRFVAGTHPILLLGPSGSGKSLLAREIAAISHRATRPFIKVDCASIPDTLLEDQLFGHVKGAFTNADGDRVGMVGLADGGTLFLDEIGELPRDVQGKLLTLVDEHTFHRVGDPRPTRVDIRIIAATNLNLEEEVAAGRFRRDLYFRLKGLEIRLPEIDARREDVPLLLDRIGVETAERLGMSWAGVTEGARLAAEARPWPGNVREIQHALEGALLRTRGQVPIDRAALLDEAPREAEPGRLETWGEALDAARRDLLVRAIALHGRQVPKISAAIELGKSQVHQYLVQFGL